jgi:polysaccharide biosynthesis protein PslE
MGMFEASLIQLLRRQAFPFLMVFAAGMGLTLLTIIYVPRKYASQAKVLLKLGRENVSVDPTVTTTGNLISLHRTYEGEINTVLHTMESREILEKVVDQVGVDAILNGSVNEEGNDKKGTPSQTKNILKGWLANLDPIDSREQAILTLQSNLSIQAGKGSSVVDITYIAKTPELAQRVAQTWVDLYRAHHSDINSTEGSLEFFEELEAKLAASLGQARSSLQEAKSKYGIVTVIGEQQTLESQVRWARSNLTETGTSLKASEARLRSLEQQLRSTDPTMVTGKDKGDTTDARDQMRDRLYQLEIEHQRIRLAYSETHPKYVASSRQLEEAKALYSQQQAHSERVTEGVNSTYEAIEQQVALEKANVDSMTAKIAAIKAELDRLLEQSTQLNLHENEVAQLQRSVDILESQYRIHVQNREQARLASELESRNISNINVFQDATLERRPVTPNKKLCFLLGFIGSLLSAFGWVTWREAKQAGLLTLAVSPTGAQETEDSQSRSRESAESGSSVHSGNGLRTGNSVVASLAINDGSTRDKVHSTLPLAPR